MTTRKGGPAKAEETGPPNNVNTRQGNGNTYYNYTDEAGEPLFRVVRRPGKKFHQERWDSGGWRLGLKGTRRALYNLPAVKAAAERGHPVFVVPGEKDADRLNALDGVTATTNPLGEGRNNWRDEYSRALVGVKGAFVVWDRDDPGRAHALRVADSLKRAGVPVRFRRALVGKDAYDHLEAGHGLSELVRQRPRDPRPTPAAKDPADPTPAEPLAAEPAVYQLALIRLREHATEHDLAQPRASDTGWECCCPAHDDHRASLGVRIGDDHPLVVSCQAGCSHEEIAAALGIDAREFSVSSKRRPSVRRSSGASPPRNARLAFDRGGPSPTLGTMLRSARKGTR